MDGHDNLMIGNGELWVSGEFSIKKDGYLIITKNAVGLAWDLEVKVMIILGYRGFQVSLVFKKMGV